MAFSKCGSCNSTFFEVKQAEPKDSSYKLVFVQCSSCGAVIGAMPYYDAGILAKDNQNKLTALSQQIAELQDQVRRLSRQ